MDMGDLGGERELSGLLERMVEATAGLKIMSRSAKSSSKVKYLDAVSDFLFHSVTNSLRVSY
jgi:hypothetical protein